MRHFAHVDFATLLYLGIPFIVALALFAVFLRKRRAELFAGAMALIALVLSMGPVLWIDGRNTSIPLPFSVIEHLPAVDGLLATRFSLYTTLFAAGMFAIGLDELWRRMRKPDGLAQPSSPWRLVGAAAAITAISLAVIVPLVPAHAQRAFPTDVPSFFTSTALDLIPPGSVALAYPYPDTFSSRFNSVVGITQSIMLDQAVAGMPFQLIGGYGWFPRGGRFGTTGPAHLKPHMIQSLFDEALAGQLRESSVTADLRDFLRNYDVQTVIVVPVSGNSARLIRSIAVAIGPPIVSGGVTVWFHVKQRLTSLSR